MAVYGPYQMSPSTSLWLYLSVTETTNVSANTSTLTYELYLQKDTAGNYNLSSGNNYSFLVNGTTIKSGDHGSITSGETHITLASGTTTVAHNADGTGSCTLQGNFSNRLGASASTGNITFALTKIPRASTISSLTSAVTLNASDATSATMKFVPLSSSFYYRYTVKIGSSTLTTQNITSWTAGTEKSVSISIPTSWASYISGTSETAGVTLTTYSDSGYTTQVGSESTANVVINLGSGWEPTADLALSYNSQFSSQNLTGRTTITATLSSISYKGGATLSNITYTISRPGSTVYSSSGTETSYTSGTFSAAGTYTVTAVIKDSRGKTVTKTETSESFLAYTKPTVFATVTRGTGTGSSFVIDETDGTTARITYTVSGYTSLTGNSQTVQYQVSGGSWTTASSSPLYITGYSAETAITFKVRVYDTVSGSGNATEIEVTLPSASFPMDFLPTGNGVAFGEVASEQETIKTAWKIKCNVGEIKNIATLSYTVVSTW